MRKPLAGCLLVSDVDGTLIDKELKIPTRNVEAIKRFTDLGGHFTLASGRSFSAVRLFADEVVTTCPIISYNGAALYDLKARRIIWQLHLPESAKTLLPDVLRRFPEIGAEVHSEGRLFLVQDSKEARIHRSDEALSFERADAAALPDVKWSKILYAGPGDRLRALESYLSTLDVRGAYHIFTSPIYFEMIPENANKGTALRELARRMGLEMKNVYAIGDFYNDAELLKAAGYAAVAGNAPKELYALADFVSDTNTQGAVAAFIDHIIQSRAQSAACR